jgi:hypothetical protein
MPLSYRSRSSRIVILVKRLRKWRSNGQSRRSAGNQGIQGFQGDGIQGGHCTRIIAKTKATTITTTTAYPRYMNFIVGRMIISDMRTSCDPYALLYRNAARTSTVGEMQRSAAEPQMNAKGYPLSSKGHGDITHDMISGDLSFAIRGMKWCWKRPSTVEPTPW